MIDKITLYTKGGTLNFIVKQYVLFNKLSLKLNITLQYYDTDKRHCNKKQYD